MVEDLKKLFSRELNKLKNEIELFEEEENLWKVTGEVKNSSGNLCLHLIGNLNTYLGKNLGNTGYTRNRELEFSQKDLSKELLIEKLEDTIQMVKSVLEKLDQQSLLKIYPENVLGYEMTVSYFLIHLYGHLSYHLGQVNYLRRVLAVKD